MPWYYFGYSWLNNWPERLRRWWKTVVTTKLSSAEPDTPETLHYLCEELLEVGRH